MHDNHIPLIAWSATAGDVAMLQLKIPTQAKLKVIYNPLAAGKDMRQALRRSAKTGGRGVRQWR